MSWALIIVVVFVLVAGTVCLVGKAIDRNSRRPRRYYEDQLRDDVQHVYDEWMKDNSPRR